MTKIFADSNFFIALSNPDDTLNEIAIQRSREIRDKKLPIVISRFIFSETVTVLSQRTNRQIAINAGIDMLSGQIGIVEIDQRVSDAAWKIFQDIGKKNMSFVDCSILAIMQAEGISKLLTFDREDFSNLRRTYDFSFY